MTRSAALEANGNQKNDFVGFIRDIAYGLAGVLARLLVRQGHFQGLRSNLAVIHRLPQDSAALDERVIENLRNAFVSYVEFFIIACRSPEAIDAACEIDPAALQLIKKHQAQGRGIVLVAAHSTSLDIFMLAMSRQFPGMQALTLPQPPLNTRIMNRLRGKYGFQLNPISSDLFGKPCQLPIGHTRLAEATDSAIVVGISQRVSPGKYRGFGIEVPSSGGDEEDWAAVVLEVLEQHIMERPQEWFMPPPLWPSPTVSEAPLLFQHRLPPALTSRLIRG
jgi:lauroyl/myristoyl acyltransferase